MGKFLPTRFGPDKAQQDNFAHTGMEVLQKKDGSVEITQKTFSELLRPIATSPPLWRDRNRALSDEELHTCQSRQGKSDRFGARGGPGNSQCRAQTFPGPLPPAAYPLPDAFGAARTL